MEYEHYFSGFGKLNKLGELVMANERGLAENVFATQCDLCDNDVPKVFRNPGNPRAFS